MRSYVVIVSEFESQMAVLDFLPAHRNVPIGRYVGICIGVERRGDVFIWACPVTMAPL